MERILGRRRGEAKGAYFLLSVKKRVWSWAMARSAHETCLRKRKGEWSDNRRAGLLRLQKKKKKKKKQLKISSHRYARRCGPNGPPEPGANHEAGLTPEAQPTNINYRFPDLGIIDWRSIVLKAECP